MNLFIRNFLSRHNPSEIDRHCHNVPHQAKTPSRTASPPRFPTRYRREGGKEKINWSNDSASSHREMRFWYRNSIRGVSSLRERNRGVSEVVNESGRGTRMLIYRKLICWREAGREISSCRLQPRAETGVIGREFKIDLPGRKKNTRRLFSCGAYRGWDNDEPGIGSASD